MPPVRPQVPGPPRRYGRPKTPVWKGPQRGGVTQSLLSRYLSCGERYRLRVIKGLTPAPTFNHKIEYGNLWHVCEEALAAGSTWPVGILGALKGYAGSLCRRFPGQQEQVEHWFNTCCTQFPLYVKHWGENPDVVGRTPILQEEKFSVPYALPSGRTVRLRGKFDAVDLIEPEGAAPGVYLQEDKTKGKVLPGQLIRQLTFDLQTMFYMTALTHDTGVQALESVKDRVPVRGVRYNVVRRPFSGGKGDIKRHKARGNTPEETRAHFYGRLAQYMIDEPADWFMRWKVEVTAGDVRKFRRECLDPILDNLWDDYEWWVWCDARGDTVDHFDYVLRADRFPDHCRRHYRHPFGVWNILDEGGCADLDEYLATGSTVGLVYDDNLFPELT